MKMKAREEAEALKAQAKRKQSEEMDDEDEQEERSTKRAKVVGGQTDEQESTAASSKPTKGFPAGFFSDPSKAPVLDEDEDEEVAADTLPTTQSTAQPQSQLDLEWEQFQKTVVNAPAVDGEAEAEDDRQVAFARATVFAEPELVKNEREGLPMDEAEETVEKPPPEETEEEKRKRIEREERELIMDRLIEEERAQEEADSRVGLLKMKVEQLKKAREMRRSQAAKSKS
jgi:zinc finger protein 830